MTLGALEIILGSLWGHFDSNFGPLGSHFWHLSVAVEDFGITLSLIWAHFGHMTISLGSLWSRSTLMKLNFQKHRFSQYIIMIFAGSYTHMRSLRGYFGVTLKL